MATYPYYYNRGANQNYGLNNTDSVNFNPKSLAGIQRFDPHNLEQLRRSQAWDEGQWGPQPSQGMPVVDENIGIPDRIKSPFRPAIQDETSWLTKGGNFLKNFSPTGIINTLTRRRGADKSFSGYPGSGWGSRSGLFPQEVSNLQELANRGQLYSGAKDFTGTNVVSLTGDYNKHIADKKADFTSKLDDDAYMARTFGNVEGVDLDSIKTLEDMEAAYRTKYGVNSAIANRLNLYANFGQGAGTGADTITDKVIDKTTSRWEPDGNVTTSGGSTYSGPPTKSFDPGLARAMGSYNRPAGPMTGNIPNSPWAGAYGGRAGYQDGELVEDEYMAEATPQGMMEENIEEVQGEPTREQLEAIAFEIFRLPLEQLNEEQLEVVYQAAMEQEPSEEEVQFAAQEGPGEGIASLV